MSTLQLSGVENVWLIEDERGLHEVEFWDTNGCVRYPIEHVPLILEFFQEHEAKIMDAIERLYTDK